MTINWLIPTFLRVIFGSLIAMSLIKLITGKGSRPLRFLLQYLFCAVLATIIAPIYGSLVVDRTVLAIGFLGFVNAFAAYCQWKAIDINMTKNSLFTIWDDIIAMVLSGIILGEAQLITSSLWVGIGLCFLSVFLFVYSDYTKKRGVTERRTPLSFYFYVLGYSVAWGCALFLIKYWSFQGVAIPKFLLGWYGGSLVGATLLYLLLKLYKPLPMTGEPVTAKDLAVLGFLSATLFVAMGCGYWALSLAPQVVVQPVFLVGESVLPALAGLLIFRERKGFGGKEWLYLILGFVGICLISLYRT